MRLRQLEKRDAPLMLEWMLDDSVTVGLHSNYSKKTIEDAEEFVKSSGLDATQEHCAIVSDEDEYEGTVSLRHIDGEASTAEFAIVVRKSAMSRGYAWFGMTEILRMAFEDYGLNSVYWRVATDNKRAIRFYEKHGFHIMDDIPQEILNRHVGEKECIWYACLNGDDYLNVNLSKGEVAGCSVISIKTISTVGAGELSFFEANRDIGFDIKRIYYISKVPEGMRRGFHAHKELKQLLFCPYGAVQMVLDNGTVREEITLNDPSVGIIIDKPTWREMLWLQKDSVLCVAASDYYNAEDYIRDFDEFVCYVEQGE